MSMNTGLGTSAGVADGPPGPTGPAGATGPPGPAGGGAVVVSIAHSASPYTPASSIANLIIMCDTSLGDITINIPVVNAAGDKATVVNTSSGTVTAWFATVGQTQSAVAVANGAGSWIGVSQILLPLSDLANPGTGKLAGDTGFPYAGAVSIGTGLALMAGVLSNSSLGLVDPTISQGDMLQRLDAPDLLLNHPELLGGNPGSTPANVVDGNDATTSTLGGGFSAGGWIMSADFGVATDIQGIRLAGDVVENSPGNFAISWYYSDDGSTWSLIHTFPHTGSFDDIQTLGSPISHRYFAVQMAPTGDGSNKTVASWSLYGSAQISRLPYIGNGNLLAGVAGEMGAVGVGTGLTISGGNLKVSGDTTWTNVQGGVGFQNSWADAAAGDATTAFRKDGSGRVDFRISAKSGASGSVMFTLPAGYRPSATNTFTGLAELLASNVSTEFAVASDGTVTITFVGSLTGNVYCTGSFYNGA